MPSLTKRLLLGAALLYGGPAMAAEGSVYGGPVGGTDIRNAYIPPFPGIYFGFANVPGYSTSLYGNNGSPNPNVHRFNFVFDAQAFAVSYVYPFKLFGGSIQTSVQESYYPYARFSINNRTQRITGWGDLYSDLLKWSYYLGEAAPPRPGARPMPYGLTVEAAYSMIFPTGTYNTHQFVTSGHNDYFIIPNFAATYLFGPNVLGDGVELDGHLFYDHALQNPTTKYSSGDIIDLDFAISERSGRLQYGFAGYYAAQIGKDKRNGITVTPEGDFYGSSRVGPVVAYDFPSIGATAKLKLQIPIYVRNTIDSPAAVFSFGIKF